MVVLNVRWS